MIACSFINSGLTCDVSRYYDGHSLMRVATMVTTEMRICSELVGGGGLEEGKTNYVATSAMTLDCPRVLLLLLLCVCVCIY